MAIDLSALFGQLPDYSAFLPNAEQDRMRANAAQQALLQSAISALSMTGQTRQPISTGQVLAGMLGAGSEGYNQAFDRTLKQMVTGMQLGEYKKKADLQKLMQESIVPKFETIPGKQTAIPSEVGPTVIETPETKKQIGFTYDLSKIEPTLLAMGSEGVDLLKKLRELTEGKQVELSKEQQQYALQRYGSSSFNSLNKDQQLDVLEFGKTPDINKALEQHIAAQKLKADTGIDLTQTTLENLQRAQRFYSTQNPNASNVQPQIRNYKDK